MHLVASVCLSVHPSVRQPQISGAQQSILRAWLFRVQQGAEKSHYQSMVFVCVWDNHTDADDRLLS